MTPEELYSIWAPEESVWSPWVSPVPFVGLNCAGRNPTGIAPSIVEGDVYRRTSTACVLDLPGDESIRFAFGLANLGFRPVPIFNAAPGPEGTSVLSMRFILDALCWGSRLLRQSVLAHDAPPAFVVDANRLRINSRPEQTFDNRWMLFPQDFPSAGFLREHGVTRVVVVSRDDSVPDEDLVHVLLRWHQAGIEVLAVASTPGAAPRQLRLRKPRGFRRAWYRALAMLGLRRSSTGGFGSHVPEPHAGG